MLNEILDDLILAEGSKYTNHAADRGGPTKYGITLNTLRGTKGKAKATAEDVKALTLEEARLIYTELYAKPFLFVNDATVFKFLLNSAVQHGVRTAIKLLQRALGVPDDGILGPQTEAAVRSAGTAIMPKLVAARCKYYASILSSDKSQLVFAAGWLNRIAKDLS